jgi:hypothetical protein
MDELPGTSAFEPASSFGVSENKMKTSGFEVNTERRLAMASPPPCCPAGRARVTVCIAAVDRVPAPFCAAPARCHYPTHRLVSRRRSGLIGKLDVLRVACDKELAPSQHD